MAPLLHLRVSRNSKPLRRALVKAPFIFAAPIVIESLPSLTAHRGHLLSGYRLGTPVHAASFIRRRRVVLEAQLLSHLLPAQFILFHELFHFAWFRLGNSRRLSFAGLIAQEGERHAAGEIGESSGVAKERWQADPTRANWKNYVCEAFCDTGATLLVPRANSHTLAARWLQNRYRWFDTHCPPNGWRC